MFSTDFIIFELPVSLSHSCIIRAIRFIAPVCMLKTASEILVGIPRSSRTAWTNSSRSSHSRCRIHHFQYEIHHFQYKIHRFYTSSRTDAPRAVAVVALEPAPAHRGAQQTIQSHCDGIAWRMRTAAPSRFSQPSHRFIILNIHHFKYKDSSFWTQNSSLWTQYSLFWTQNSSFWIQNSSFQLPPLPVPCAALPWPYNTNHHL